VYEMANLTTAPRPWLFFQFPRNWERFVKNFREYYEAYG